MTDWNFEPKKYPLGSSMIPARKQLYVFLMGWLGFQILATIVQYTATSFFAVSNGITMTQAAYLPIVQILVNTAAYGLLLIILLLITSSDILKLLSSFLQYQSLIAGVVCLLCIYAFDIFYGNIVRLIPIPVTNNVNEQGVESLQHAFPILSLIAFGFIAPVCEELTYRVGLYSLLKRKSRALAYGVTIALFTLIHANFTLSNFINELLNLPYYAFAAFAFCYTYEKYGFAASTTAHILNNTVSCLFAMFN